MSLKRDIEAGTLVTNVDGVWRQFGLEIDGKHYSASEVTSIKPYSIRIRYAPYAQLGVPESSPPIFDRSRVIIREYLLEDEVVNEVEVISTRVVKTTGRCEENVLDLEYYDIFDALVIG